MKLASHDIIRKPVITKKGMVAMAENKYTFIVYIAVNKAQIKRTVKGVFNVKVADVKAMRLERKTKRVGIHIGKRADFKKAVVALAEGSGIELFEGMQQ